MMGENQALREKYEKLEQTVHESSQACFSSTHTQDEEEPEAQFPAWNSDSDDPIVRQAHVPMDYAHATSLGYGI